MPVRLCLLLFLLHHWKQYSDPTSTEGGEFLRDSIFRHIPTKVDLFRFDHHPHHFHHHNHHHGFIVVILINLINGHYSHHHHPRQSHHFRYLHHYHYYHHCHHYFHHHYHHRCHCHHHDHHHRHHCYVILVLLVTIAVILINLNNVCVRMVCHHHHHCCRHWHYHHPHRYQHLCHGGCHDFHSIYHHLRHHQHHYHPHHPHHIHHYCHLYQHRQHNFYHHHSSSTTGSSTPPLPDTGQWLLLALNEKLPLWAVEVLRAHIIGLHHYLMLFIMLAFSVLFSSVKAPGLGLAARYMFTMAIGRLLRAATFVSTILPSLRPWCASARFPVPSHPHPWAQKYYIPYASNSDAIRRLIQTDTLQGKCTILFIFLNPH